MCLVCVFLMIKKADNVLNNNFLIRFLSLIYSFSSVFIPFSSVFSLPSEQKTKKPNPRTSSSPSTPKKIHGWALRSSELSADQYLQPEIYTTPFTDLQAQFFPLLLLILLLYFFSVSFFLSLNLHLPRDRFASSRDRFSVRPIQEEAFWRWRGRIENKISAVTICELCICGFQFVLLRSCRL